MLRMCLHQSTRIRLITLCVSELSLEEQAEISGMVISDTVVNFYKYTLSALVQ